MIPKLVAPRGSRLGTAVSTAAALIALAAVPSAQAAKTNIYFDVSVFPADFQWDGSGTPPASPSTGSYYVDYDVRSYDGAKGENYKTQQLRGGAVIRESGASNEAPVSVLPGDVFRAVRVDGGAVLAEASFGGQPVITSSLLGQPAFAGTYAPGSTEISVSLQRRIPRNETSSYRPTQAPRATNAFEVVSRGRITALGDSTFGGTFSTPINGGDYVTASQYTSTIANDTSTTTWFSVTAPAGAVPPKDVVPPKILRVLLGVKSVEASKFGKSGLNTFVTLDEPGTVTQTLTEDKSKGGKKKAVQTAAPKKKKPKKPKKPKAPKAPTVLADATGKVGAANETAPLTLKATKKGKSLFKKVGKKGLKVTLTTTATDLAGNTTTSTQSFKLTGKKK